MKYCSVCGAHYGYGTAVCSHTGTPHVWVETTVTPNIGRPIHYIHIQCEDCKRLQAEIEALRAKVIEYEEMLSHKDFCGISIWSYHPLYFDDPVSIEYNTAEKKWTWYQDRDEGRLIENAPRCDTALEAFQALQAAQTLSDGATAID